MTDEESNCWMVHCEYAPNHGHVIRCRAAVWGPDRTPLGPWHDTNCDLSVGMEQGHNWTKALAAIALAELDGEKSGYPREPCDAKASRRRKATP